MKNKKILEKAIQKAIDGGWTGVGYFISQHEVKYTNRLFGTINTDLGVKATFTCEVGPISETQSEIIFNHDFAKALWNTPMFTTLNELYFETRDGRSEWQYHLQQMVISDDPIKYLGENI